MLSIKELATAKFNESIDVSVQLGVDPKKSDQVVRGSVVLPDRVLDHLKLLDGDYGGFPIDRLQHSLQTATRAERGGESEDYVVMALLFLVAPLVVIVWALLGRVFRYSDTWQLVINTSTTIITFLMVFIIQQSQNKDSLAIQLKLNELIACEERASNRLIALRGNIALIKDDTGFYTGFIQIPSKV